MEKQLSIVESIRAAYYSLTGAEKKVADYVLANPELVQDMSITQLADECGVADATVSRFCRSLQTKGFSSFKLELARLTASNAAKEEISPRGDTTEGRCAESVRTANESIQQTFDLLKPKQVKKAVDLIDGASRILCFGSGSSMLLANKCSVIFSETNNKFFTVADTHSQLSAIATMSENDLVILFSYSGATTDGILVLGQAKKRGIRCILITRYSKSPAAKLADVVLCCGSNEGPYLSASVASSIAQLMIIDFLHREYVHRHQVECEQNRLKIAAALAEIHI